LFIFIYFSHEFIALEKQNTMPMLSIGKMTTSQ